MRAPVVVGMVLVAATGLVGCSGPRSGVSVQSAVDACAVALPVAQAAVHKEGKLVRIRALRRTDVATLAHQLGLPPPASPTPSETGTPTASVSTSRPGHPITRHPATHHPSARVPSTVARGSATYPSTVLSGTTLPPEPEPRGCAVAFAADDGKNYQAASVDRSIGLPQGKYAIALVRLHETRLIVVILARSLPKLLLRK